MRARGWDSEQCRVGAERFSEDRFVAALERELERVLGADPRPRAGDPALV